MANAAIEDPENFLIIIDGGAPAAREPVVAGTIDGSLAGPDTLIDIVLELRPPAETDVDIHITQTFSPQPHLHLQFDLLA